MVKSKIKRLVSMVSAAACMATCLNVSSVIDISDANAVEVKDAFAITEEMGLGWNLGNSLDAYNGNLETMGLESETCWGNPVTTQEMINAVKAKGFNTVRVPTTWYQHVDVNNGYKIDDAYMARVKEVVNYAYNNDMYVILNLHHEEKYQNRSTLGDDYEEISGFVTSVWKQIAEEFKDYDQHLIFETMNEPRATGTDHEWWGPTQAEVDTINKLNADALAVIRSVESDYNKVRLVMMPSYCASSDISMMSKTIIPDDDFAAASVHAYTPYNFAMNAEITDHSTFTAAYANEITSVMDGVRKTFSDKDIPVILGEFSASNFGNTEARCEWAEYYIKTVKEYGFPAVLWDNNVEANNGGEAHGYLKRSDCTWFPASEPVVDTMVKVINDSSVVFGSQRKSPVIEHDDISTGKVLNSKEYSLDSEVLNGNCTEGLNADWKTLEGKDVAIKYTGDVPVIAVVDSDWDNWTEIKPYDIDEANGIAYYSSSHIESAWSGEASAIAHLFARTNSKTVVEKIVIIGAGEAGEQPDEPEVVMEVVDLSKTDRESLTFTITGAAGSTTNGCVGYMGEDWEMIEWEGKIGSDGKLEVTVDISKIPASVSAAQVQIWWCDDKEATLTIGKTDDKPQDTTTAPTTEPTTDKPSDLVITVIGDANGDEVMNMADATFIVQHVGNKDKYKLSEQAEINCDVDGVPGITGTDALVIQKVIAKLIPASDLPLQAS